MKVSGLRSMVLDDVGARKTPVADGAPIPLSGTLSGTDRLDERVAAWLKERERFVRRPSTPASSQADASAPSPPT
ncbi:MAG TPA: hypothetical protein VIZ68_08290 [Thermoplasmata archaeon]